MLPKRVYGPYTRICVWPQFCGSFGPEALQGGLLYSKGPKNPNAGFQGFYLRSCTHGPG